MADQGQTIPLFISLEDVEGVVPSSLEVPSLGIQITRLMAHTRSDCFAAIFAALVGVRGAAGD
jgi:hypothetical protein